MLANRVTKRRSPEDERRMRVPGVRFSSVAVLSSAGCPHCWSQEPCSSSLMAASYGAPRTDSRQRARMGSRLRPDIQFGGDVGVGERRLADQQLHQQPRSGGNVSIASRRALFRSDLRRGLRQCIVLPPAPADGPWSGRQYGAASNHPGTKRVCVDGPTGEAAAALLAARSPLDVMTGSRPYRAHATPRQPSLCNKVLPWALVCFDQRICPFPDQAGGFSPASSKTGWLSSRRP